MTEMTLSLHVRPIDETACILDIQGDINSTTVGGTLTSKTGTVNQAAFVWNIRNV